MALKRFNFDIQEIAGLYFDQDWSLQQIAKKYGCTRHLVGLRLKEAGFKLKNRNGKIGEAFKVNEKFFDYWSDDMAYALGYITADGGVRSHKYELKLKSIDYELLEYMQNLLETNYEIKEEKGTRCYVLRIFSKRLIDSLAKLGVSDRKSLTVEMADVPRKYFWSYLRGLVDGDGHISPPKEFSTHVRFQLTSNGGFLESIKKRLSTEVDCPDYELNPQGKAYCLGVYGKPAYLAMKKMYANDLYGLSRKKSAARAAIAAFERKIHCKDCGKIIRFAHPNRRRCNECTKEAQREANRRSRAKKHRKD